MAEYRPRLTALRRFWLPLVAVGLVAALLVGWWQPWQVATPAPSPTPPRPVALLPTPTSTRPENAAPTATSAPPTRGTSASLATPATSAGAPTTTRQGPRAAGTILYSSSVASWQGIVAAPADGGAHDLLVAGHYGEITWSPRGDRFAAVGLLDGRNAQIAIFTPEGRPLARYAFGGAVSRLLWSPDGSRLACAVAPWGTNTANIDTPNETWLIAGWAEPQRVGLPDRRQVYPFAWTPSNTLYAISYDTPAAGYSVWQVSPDGTNAYRDAGGSFIPLGLVDAGETLIVATMPYVQAPGIPPRGGLAAIEAINLRSDERRTLIDAASLHRQVFGEEVAATSYQLAVSSHAFSPTGERLALNLVRQATPVLPGRPREESALVALSLDGTVTGSVRLLEGVYLGVLAWSPDGRYLAYLALGGAISEFALKIIDPAGTPVGSFPVGSTGTYDGLAAAWSPDSRWLVYTAPAALTVVSASGDPAYSLNANGGFPAWRPR